MNVHATLDLAPEDITDAMNENPDFAWALWSELAEKLSAGLLADNLMDLLAGQPDRDVARRLIATFQDTFNRLESLQDSYD